MYKASVILAEVNRLRKEYPDAVYNSNECSYSKGHVKNGPKTKGCIIGQAIRNVYPDLFKKIKLVYDGYEVNRIILGYKVDGSAKQINKLKNIQWHQDRKVPWGICGTQKGEEYVP